MNRKLRLSSYLAVVAVLFFGFQNCGSKFQISNQSSEATSAGPSNPLSSGNGATGAAADDKVELKTFPAGLTKSKTAEFVFNAGNLFDLNNTSLECSVDSNPVNCASLWTEVTAISSTVRQVKVKFTNLTDAVHTLRFRDTKNTYIDHIWTVDATAPAIQINPAFAVNTTANDAAFNVVVTDQFTTSPRLECRYDAAAFAPCILPFRINGLSEGPHTFSARATDDAGNMSAISNYSFEVLSASSVTVRILNKPAIATADTTATFTFERGSAIASLRCSVNNVLVGVCTDGVVYNDLDTGNYKLVVQGLNSIGNVVTTVEYSWEIQLPPVWLNFQAKQVIPNPESNQYKLVLQSENATSYKWEVFGKPAVMTTVPEYTMIVDYQGESRVLSYCVTAINKAAEVKACGEVVLSMFSVKAGKLYYEDNAHWNQPTDITKVKILGLLFATDGSYLYQGYVHRTSVAAEPVGLSVYHYAVGADVYFSDQYQSPNFENANSAQLNDKKVGALANWKLISTDGRGGITSASRLSQIGNAVYYQGTEVGNISSQSVQYKPSPAVRLKIISDSDSVSVLAGTEFVTLSGADAPTLTYIDSSYYYDKNNIYYLNYDKSVVSTAFVGQSFTVKSSHWLISGTKIFYKASLIPNASPPIDFTSDPYMHAAGKVYRADVDLNINAAGFKLALSDTSSAGSVDLFADNTAVYLYDFKTKVKTVVPGASGASFKTIYTNGYYTNPLSVSSLDGFYFSDDDQIFSIKGTSPNYTVTDVQAQSIANPKMLSPGAALLTSSGVYVYTTKQSVTNPAALAIVNNTAYLKDDVAVYAYQYRVKLHNLGAATVIGYNHAKNCAINKAYYGGEEIVGADCETFEASTFSSVWSRDANKCYIGTAVHSDKPSQCLGFW